MLQLQIIPSSRAITWTRVNTYFLLRLHSLWWFLAAVFLASNSRNLEELQGCRSKTIHVIAETKYPTMFAKQYRPRCELRKFIRRFLMADNYYYVHVVYRVHSVYILIIHCNIHAAYSVDVFKYRTVGREFTRAIAFYLIPPYRIMWLWKCYRHLTSSVICTKIILERCQEL